VLLVLVVLSGHWCLDELTYYLDHRLCFRLRPTTTQKNTDDVMTFIFFKQNAVLGLEEASG